MRSGGVGMKIVILAAGLGSRLGNPWPKALTKLNIEKSIMKQQIDCLMKYVHLDDIFVVVGYKKELIMEAFPELMYVYNNYYDTTNTSKSLLRGLRKAQGHDVIWVNGDLVFEDKVVERMMIYPGSCMAVNTSSVAEEEVKYLKSHDGAIQEISKEIQGGLGEALGINKIQKNDLALLIECLKECKDDDYFEKAIEIAIAKGLKIYANDVTDLMCAEIDFKEDLDKVNLELSKLYAK